jgi:hypothetical protein
MKKRLLFTLPFVLMCLCLQTALAQQPSPAPAKRSPQLTSDDLETAPAPPPAEEVVPAAKAAPAPVTRNTSPSWSRHAYSDLGLSMEFPGIPPKPMAMQLQLPENPIADRNVQAQIFEGGDWNMLIMAINLSQMPSGEGLRAGLAEIASGFAESIGVMNPNVAPEPGSNPSFRISGTINRQNQTRNFGGRLTVQGSKLFFITIDCLPANTRGCLEAKRILESTKPTL